MTERKFGLVASIGVPCYKVIRRQRINNCRRCGTIPMVIDVGIPRLQRLVIKKNGHFLELAWNEARLEISHCLRIICIKWDARVFHMA